MVEIIWYLPGFQLSHYTEGFCSASPLEEILAYTFSRYPIKSTTAAFIKRRRCAFILCFICYIMEYDSIFDFEGLIWKQFSRNYYISVSICVCASKWPCHSLRKRHLTRCSEQLRAFTPLWVSNEHVRFQMCSLTKWLVALDTNLWSFFPWVSMCGYSDVLLDQLRWNVKNISLIYSARAWWWWWPVLKEYKSLRGRASFWHFSDRVWEAWKAGGW